jgi:hypothetical protein
MGGLVVLSFAWGTASTLIAQVRSHPPAAASLAELGLCALLVVSLLVGNALLMLGPGLWKRVAIPARWGAALIETRQFDVLLYRDERNPLPRPSVISCKGEYP